MKIIPLDHQARFVGGLELRRYLAAILCGPKMSDTYYFGMSREGGAAAVPGIVDALLDIGITEREEVVCAAARVSRCRSSTVEEIVATLTGNDDATHFWHEDGGELYAHDGPPSSLPRFILES